MIFIDSSNNEYEPTRWLTFNDVLLKPQRSRFKSRNDEEISLNTSLGEGLSLDIPIISSNMDTVTGKDMASAMFRLGGLGILHRFYKSPTELAGEIDEVYKLCSRVAFSVGCGDKWVEFVRNLARDYQPTEASQMIVCLDVAHGHMEQSIETVEALSQIENVFVIAGNVATGDGAADLADAGAKCIKVGVGSGCFTSDNKVITKNGSKNIDQIQVGEEVLTHRNRYKKVVGKMVRQENKKLISINGIKSTDNHEYYVLHKKYKDIANDENINEYAEWVRAKDLSPEYFLLKINKE